MKLNWNTFLPKIKNKKWKTKMRACDKLSSTCKDNKMKVEEFEFKYENEIEKNDYQKLE